MLHTKVFLGRPSSHSTKPVPSHQSKKAKQAASKKLINKA
jgi:hypothetical protein